MLLIEKIEAFIKKFYLNRLIKGGLIGAVMLIVSFLTINGIEYFSWLPSVGRKILLIILTCIYAIVLVYYFIIPIINLLRFRKKMTHKQAAVLIGKFFPDISDKLLNTLQLNESLVNEKDNELLIATIEQRTKNLQPIPFTNAVDLKKNFKYLKYFGLSAILLIILMIFAPNFAKKPAERIINYSQEYAKPLPFNVILSGTRIEAVEGSDVEYKITIEGEKIPERFYVKGNSTRLMNKLAANEFKIVFKNIYQTESFHIEGGDYISPEIQIVVNPSPTLLFYETSLKYPKYIKRDNETLSGKTRIIVPQGTEADFIFHTRNVNSLYITIDSIEYQPTRENSDFHFSFKAMKSAKLNVFIANQWKSTKDPITFTVDVIRDAYPEIQIQPFHEDFSKRYYYSGLVADDYGFTKLQYHFEVEDRPQLSFIKNIEIDKKSNRASFYYSVDLDTITLYAEDEVKSYFEIWDNDGINGPKSSKSETVYLSLPSKAALDSVADASTEEIINKLDQKSSELQDLRKDIEDLLRDLMSKKNIDWTDKEKLQSLLEKQKEVEDEWNKMQEEQKKLNEFLKDNELTSEELLKKQEQINKLFEDVVPDELKKLMDEIQQLMSEMPREQMQEIMKELKQNNKTLQEMMDRNLSLLEQLKVEKDFNDFINELNELAEQLEKMNESNNDSLSADKAQNQFEKLQQDLDSIMKKNEGLNEPMQISKDEQLTEDIEQDLDEAGDAEESGDNEQSSQKKNSAGKKMKQMAEQMQSLMMGGESEQLAEDAHLVRILLENVVRSSHAEESLMQEISGIKKDDPSIPDKISRQKDITDNLKMVEDSLREMAMRQPMIQSFVFTELQNIDVHLNNAMENIRGAVLTTASSNQQHAMMSMNNLALMLAESLENMDDMMSNMSSSGKCNKPKPGKGKGNMKSMKDLQEQLGNQLKEMQKSMQQNKNGQPQNMSEEFARMAAEQEMIRQGMQQILEEMKENGTLGDDGLNQIIKDMERLEEDLVNKRLTNQMIQRTKDIMSRMLEAENAQQEREKEEKRKSNEFKGKIEKRSIDELQYEETIKKQQEFLKTNSIEFQPFYKTKINEYFFRKGQQ